MRGFLFVKCDEIKDIYALFRRIYSTILKQVELTEVQQQERNKIASEIELERYLISYFKHSERFKAQKKRTWKKIDASDLFFLCLDNVQLLLQDEAVALKFRAFLVKLYDECENLRTLVTSNQLLGDLNENISPQVQFVKPLSPYESAKLFLSRCGTLENDDIVDFII